MQVNSSRSPSIGPVLGEIADSRAAHLGYFCARRRNFLIFEKTKPASAGLLL
jgi:hypothetical protein